MRITMEDIRKGGGCAWGLREFFKRYGLDLNAFIKNGYIDSQEFMNTGDALAIHIVELKQQSEINNGQQR